MNETAGTAGGPGGGLDPRGAAAIMTQAGERARRELRVRRPVVLGTWAVVVLVSYGAMWLSVRGQRPVTGPAWETLLLAFLLFLAAAGITANVVDRAAAGVGGRSEFQRGIFCLALAAGFAALEIVKQALWQAGLSHQLAALLGEAIPMLVAGLVLVASSATAARPDWPRLALGLWLLAVAAGGTWAGPVTGLAVAALAGGGGIAAMAVIEPRLRRS
jgi:hypothetical protein